MIAKAKLVVLLAVIAAALALPGLARADFGFVPGSVYTKALNSDGTVDTRAGGHPYSYILHFELLTDEAGQTEGGELRDARVQLPPGLFGNPASMPRCPQQDFEGGSRACPLESQVGTLKAILPGIGLIEGAIYNVVPPPGVAAEFGFFSGGTELISMQYFTVAPEEGYAVKVAAPNLPIGTSSVTEEIWGTPADPGHDPERGPNLEGGTSGAQRIPYLTLPTDCEGVPTAILEADSTLAPGLFVSALAPSLDGAGDPVPLSGCESVPFSPTVAAAPGSSRSETPSGFDFELSLPNEGLLDQKSVAETEPVKAEVALPPGLALNPSAASGLQACSKAQFKAATGLPGSGCPEASKIGTLVAQTPLLEEAVEGSLYLATPHANPFDSLLALYLVARAPERGILVKQAGEVAIDPGSGRLTTTFDDLPPLPYSDLQLRLREGARAPLTTPQTCGTYTTTARLYPHSDPDSALQRSVPFKIDQGAGGSPCASSEADLPSAPTMSAGTATPVAGAYSPFVFRVSREDGSQRFGALQATLPKGLTGRLAGVPYCPEAAIAAAAARSGEGEGAAESASPSCPAASQVGSVDVGAGSGPTPFHATGRAYLAGPYKGAPLSLAIVTPAIAGPIDLGTVVVRTALSVDLFSAQIHATSDPLPTALHGIPLDIRSVALRMDRPDFTLNPTSCDPTAVGATLVSTLGVTSPLSSRFQVGGCEGLDFKPKLALSLRGATKRTGFPALKAVVTFPQKGAFANVATAQVGLPRSEFLAQENLDKVCTQPQLRSATCPARAVYGYARAWTPLLDKPLEGPVYLGVGFGHKLPDLVADLNGQIRILLHGRTDTTPDGGLRNTFEAVPDAPVSKFVLELKGGSNYGLLRNSENLCSRTQRASARFVAQSGKVLKLAPKIANGCKRKKGS